MYAHVCVIRSPEGDNSAELYERSYIKLGTSMNHSSSNLSFSLTCTPLAISDAEIKVPSAVSSDCQSVLPCKHGVDQRNVALSTLPAARDSILHLSFLPSWFDLLYV